MAGTINEGIQGRQAHAVDEPQRRLGDGSDLFVGDFVATRRNDRDLTTDLGTGVRNRQVWTVEGLGADGTVVVADADRGRAVLPPAYVDQPVALGWAVTG